MGEGDARGGDTIFALATPAGRGAIAVVRLSGPGAQGAVRALCGRVPAPRRATRRRLVDPATRAVLDDALVLSFPSPSSYTGEDVVELHLHGGRGVIEGVSAALLALGLRPGAAGEFTRRAYLNGKMSLLEAESVADLIEAESVAQRRQALDQLGGSSGRTILRWQHILLDALAALEAEIDFPDEGLAFAGRARRDAPLRALAAELRAMLADRRAARVRDGFHIVLVGPPNAGKSSLMNVLVGEDAAIVSPVAGTTRDVVERTLDLNGYRVRLSDTAGLAVATDPVEAEGVRRAERLIAEADLRLWILPPGAAGGAFRMQPGDLVVFSKSDLEVPGRRAADAAPEVLAVSVRDASWLALRARLAQIVEARLAGSEAAVIVRQRHLEAVSSAVAHVDAALNAPAELAAESLRIAHDALGALIGRLENEAVLDRVFASFCIGK